MRALLDVNVLVALLDRQHVAHGRAHVWLAQTGVRRGRSAVSSRRPGGRGQ